MMASSGRVRIYIIAIVAMCTLAVIFVLGITAIKPDADNTPTIGVVLGIFTPMVAGLMAAALKENHDAMNSRLTQLLELTEKAAKAEGKLSQDGPIERGSE
jgi:hypothetical protein